MSSWSSSVPGGTGWTRWMMAAGVAVISFSAILVRLSDASPVTITFFRAAYALPVLLAIRLVTPNRVARTARQKKLAFAAGLALAADFTFWHLAIELIGAGLATVVGSIHVVVTMLAGWLLLAQRPTKLALAATPIVLFGVVLISGYGSSGGHGEDPVLGVVFGVLTAVLYTAFLLLLRQASTTGTPPVDALLEATAGVAFGAVLLAPLDPSFSVVPSWPSHGWLVALALGAQVTGWLLITYALPQLELWETSLVLVLQPGATILWAYLILNEVFSMSQWIGLCLVVVGVTVVTVSRALHSPDREALGQRDAPSTT